MRDAHLVMVSLCMSSCSVKKGCKVALVSLLADLTEYLQSPSASCWTGVTMFDWSLILLVTQDLPLLPTSCHSNPSSLSRRAAGTEESDWVSSTTLRRETISSLIMLSRQVRNSSASSWRPSMT